MNEQITLSLDAGPSPVLIAGVDEVGRGPLAGPVVAAAVILHPERPIDGLNDSKKLSERQRERLAAQIHASAMAVSIAEASVEEIDEINILQATWRAMRRAVDGLAHRPAQCLIDGNQCPKLPMPATAVVGGDGSEACISAASIVAKVHRDRMMVAYAETYPGYGFERHKGYGTAFHMAALSALGVTPLHRRSFKPIGDMVLQAAEDAV